MKRGVRASLIEYYKPLAPSLGFTSRQTQIQSAMAGSARHHRIVRGNKKEGGRAVGDEAAASTPILRKRTTGNNLKRGRVDQSEKTDE